MRTLITKFDADIREVVARHKAAIQRTNNGDAQNEAIIKRPLWKRLISPSRYKYVPAYPAPLPPEIEKRAKEMGIL